MPENQEKQTTLLEDVQQIQKQTQPSGFFKFLSVVNAVDQAGQGNIQPLMRMENQKILNQQAQKLAEQGNFLQGTAKNKAFRLLTKHKFDEVQKLIANEQFREETAQSLDGVIGALPNVNQQKFLRSLAKNDPRAAFSLALTATNKSISQLEKEAQQLKPNKAIAAVEDAAKKIQSSGLLLNKDTTPEEIVQIGIQPSVAKQIVAKLETAQGDVLPQALPQAIFGQKLAREEFLRKVKEKQLEQQAEQIRLGQPAKPAQAAQPLEKISAQPSKKFKPGQIVESASTGRRFKVNAFGKLEEIK